jgi:hypothetical protein
MKQLVLLLITVFFISACSAKDETVAGKIAKLNGEASKITADRSNRRVTELFNKTLDVAFYNSVCNETDALRDDAFDKDDFSKVDLFAEKAKPVYRIVIGGDANFVGPNVEFFFSKCAPNTSEYRFFELAMTGWADLNGEIHGGKENFPAWIEQVDGISGNLKRNEGADALRLWKALLPELSGNYKQVALNTIQYIENLMKGTD